MDDDLLLPNVGEFLTAVFSVAVGIGLATYTISKYIYSPWAKEYQEEKRHPIPYEYKHIHDFQELNDRDISKEELHKLKKFFVTDETPQGNVILSWDEEKETFIYYADTKEIRYKYLETVARKYAVNCRCKSIYIKTWEEMKNAVDVYREKKAKRENKAEMNENPETNEDSEPDIFANFKSYNKKNENIAQDEDAKPRVLRERANRYSYRGKLEEFITTCKEQEEEKKPKDKKLEVNFAMFKQLKNQPQES